jgi:hypothetical protein
LEECSYAMKRRLPANQGGGDDANVIFQGIMVVSRQPSKAQLMA